MNRMNCEYLLDVYPDVLNGSASGETAATVRAHLASCADCREAVSVLAALHGEPVLVPAGLHERVIAQVRAPRQSWTRHYAIAATLAAAALGGSLLFNLGRASDAEPATQVGLGFVTVEDAMVSGTTSLNDLTIEELEQLLGEIDS